MGDTTEQKRYAITQHRRHGRIRYSIDKLGVDGRYLCQAAAFFTTHEAATRRLREMVEEDRAEMERAEARRANAH